MDAKGTFHKCNEYYNNYYSLKKVNASLSGTFETDHHNQ